MKFLYKINSGHSVVLYNKFKLISLSLFLIIFVSYKSHAQVRSESCRSTLDSISKAYYLGQFSKMDSLFKEYLRSDCKKTDQNTTLRIFEIVIKQRLADGYRIKEADSLQKIVDTLATSIVKAQRKLKYYSNNNNYLFKIGPGGSGDFSQFGKAGWTTGVMFGINFGDLDDSGTGLDAGAFYQKMPFTFNVVNNKDNQNNYLQNGYFLKTNGYASVYKFPVMISFNDYSSVIGTGIFFGAELLKITSTYIYNYYYENNYVDVYDPVNASHHLSFNSYSNSNYKNNSFFENKTIISLNIGINFNLRLSNRLMMTLSSEYSHYLSNKLNITGDNYSNGINYFEFRIICSYLFAKKRNVRDSNLKYIMK